MGDSHPDPAALASALATVRQFRSSRLGSDEWRAACVEVAVWLAANAGELWRKVKCEYCEDFKARRRADPTIGNPGHRCLTCGLPMGNGYLLEPAIPEAAP